MQIQTDRLGEIPIDPLKIIDFPAGLPGFPGERCFVLLKQGLEDAPFWWLQSVDEPALCFLLLEAAAGFPDYGIQLPPSDLRQLQLEAADAAETLLVVTVPEAGLRWATANLKAPVVINPLRRIGLQAILEQPYPIRQPLFSPAEV